MRIEIQNGDKRQYGRRSMIEATSSPTFLRFVNMQIGGRDLSLQAGE